jgi:putative membrane-bound dehydrogenase-like protein
MLRVPLLLVAVLAVGPASAADPGVVPVGADGLPLNLGFEAGTLKDWTADGPAFRDQPIKGDTVTPRRPGMKSNHDGRFWAGSYERAGDKPQGTLTSAEFPVTHPWASFLVGGGAAARETCVEVVVQPRNEVIFRASGLDREDMGRVAVDLTKYVGRTIQVRVADRSSGPWGHVNYDDFRFHPAKPNLPNREGKELPPPDAHKYAGLPPEKAAAAMTVPEGFEVRLFAGEPDVHQPVAMCLDDRGRLWVAEAYTYPKRNPAPGPLLQPDQRAGGDRIIIFEDTDGDGKHDKRTVFLEGLNLVSGLEVGFGGVWVGAAPYLLFVPDKNGDDKPDGDPQVLLDGWGYEDTHETLNTFLWGPDGWLYGCHGVFTHSKVGKPGTPDDQRAKINAGIWRYHPTRHQFEVFARGTSNPWGLDYNDVGDFFIEACVIPHSFHIVQGGRYVRQAGQDFNPYTYVEIPTIADHRHYVGPTPHGGNNRSDDAGGGHAHCGLMCYLGGTWPKEYRGQLFMGNIHGRRLNVDVPEPKGSGYVAKHGKDFLLANDAWARFINLRSGPDGNVYLIDWYDKQACHKREPEVWDRTNGRVYKVVYKGAKPVVGVDLQKATDAELVRFQLSENDWYVRHARRVLQERAESFGRDAQRSAAVRAGLEEIAFKHPDESRRLRGLWALHAIGGFGADAAQAACEDRSEWVRGWAVRLGFENGTGIGNTGAARVLGMSGDSSPVVRRFFASALMRGFGRVVGRRPTAVADLLAHPEDAADPVLPYLLWYTAEPLAENGTAAALKLAAEAKLPTLLPLMARRVGAIGTLAAADALVAALGKAESVDHQLAYLRGLQEAVKGRRQTAVPTGWAAVYAELAASESADVRSQAQTLAVSFGDESALAALRGTLADPTAPLPGRQAALAALVEARDKKLPALLHKLVAEPALRPAVVRGLAAFDDPATPAVLLAAYPTVAPAERRDMLATLAARPAYGRALLDAVASKSVPSADVPAEVLRQLRNLGDPALSAKIEAVWGTVRETAADRKQLIAAWQTKLANPDPPADPSHGRAVYAKTCQQCHTLFGAGGKVGPDITGANRADLGYLLENLFDPSAVIPKEYAATKLDLADGRVVTGIVKDETPRTLTVVTATETLTVPVADVDERTPSPLSMMPDDVVRQLPEPELRALVAYLRSPAQVPVAATADTAKDFFNGKDLTGWVGDPKLWSVENGELVGKSPGLKRNEFLRSDLTASDFRLTLKVKLVPNAGNSGIQFRSEPLADGEMRGAQADIGVGWWGKLYEERGRGLLWPESGEAHVKPGDWTEYVVEAVGDKVKTFINGKPCVDLTDPKLARRGLFAFQLHSGGPFEVRFKDIRLEVLSPMQK